jgi:hypothetical protein
MVDGKLLYRYAALAAQPYHQRKGYLAFATRPGTRLLSIAMRTKMVAPANVGRRSANPIACRRSEPIAAMRTVPPAGGCTVPVSCIAISASAAATGADSQADCKLR